MIKQTSLWHQSVTIFRRNLIHIRRMPELLLDVTIQPIMFVLLFAYVFGGAIAVAAPAGYREWLLGGIMGQTMAFSGFIVALGLNNDIGKGIVDRFRSLPISPAAVLVGRSMSSLAHASIGIVVMSSTGLIVGWRIRGTWWEALAAYGLLIMWGFSMIWIGILVGSIMQSVEAVNGVMMTTLFPITFLSNAFAPSESMGTVLRAIAEWNPISSLVLAIRQLWGNAGPAPADSHLPLQYPVLSTVIWTVAIVAALAPLSLRAFRARTRD